MRHRRGLWVVGAAILLMLGCTRDYYRNFADRDVYRIQNERQFDWRWQLPERPVEADPQSRIGDVHDPNREPIPPDDPGARPFQVTAGRRHEFHGWAKRGAAPVEDLSWMQSVERDEDGNLVLNRASSMSVALMNSRDYQTQVENVYLQALGLTLSRFTYFPQLFSNQSTQYRRYGGVQNGSSQLQLITNDALNWTFFSGASLLVNFANALVFEYDGHQFQRVNSGLIVNLTQPLLRGAFARNQTQPLSLQERQTLYTVRNFAQYRRGFYVDTISGYLQLLTQVQQILNQQNQVQSLKRNLEEYDALVKAGLLDPLQRDTVAQSYQQARLSLLQQEAGFQTALDLYRVQQLGLPPDFPVKIDETLLGQFELNNPALDELRRKNDALYLALLQFDAPPAEQIVEESALSLLDELRGLQKVAAEVGKELEQWRARIASEKDRIGAGPGPIEQDERESFTRQVELARELSEAHLESVASLEDNIVDAADLIDSLPKADPAASFAKLRQDFVGRDFRARLSELFVIQTQARVYLIELKGVELTTEQAIAYALANRLDLMNSLAQVTDAWRNVEVAGNSLLAGLNLTYNGALNTDPGHLGIFRFDASNSLHQVGLRFDAPIVRRVERNNFRADQITFQRARRAYMLTHDQIVRGIRLDMRNLNLYRRQFEIGRESLLIAARQVDQAEYNARTSTGASSGGGQSAGLNLLNALNGLLGAKNGLIQFWVQFEVQRMGLYRDFDTMDIDAQGVWTNDRKTPTAPGGRGTVASAPDPVGSGREELYPGPARTPDPADLDAGPVVPGTTPPPPLPGE